MTVERKHKYGLDGNEKRTVYCVLDRAYESREEAQKAVDAICNAGYGVIQIEEYEV